MEQHITAYPPSGKALEKNSLIKLLKRILTLTEKEKKNKNKEKRTKKYI